ncbi:dynein regulatory complex protein 10 [Hyperolius riggenbachi]|uniref:dynein regulatory complex protein 10 n=1 Tax=Hyperolius riggenbachi TaxID=752182 RepID=UPI0035A2B14D
MASEVLPVSQVPLLVSPQQYEIGGKVLRSVQKLQPTAEGMKMLEPGRKKLSSVETQRVVAVLDDTIKRLEIVSLFQHAIENLDRYSIVFGSELSGALREHQRLRDNMQRQLNHFSQEAAEEEDEAESVWEKSRVDMAVLHQGVQSSVRNILRLFLANPTASKTLRAEGQARNQDFQKLIQVLSELRGFLFEMLLTSPLEKDERMHYLQELTLRDHKNREALSALEEELNAAILDRDNEIAKKNEIIRQLKISLHQLEKASETQVRRTMQEAENQQKSDRRASEGKCAKFQQDLQQLRTQLNGAIAENREIELSLRKKKYKVETEIENWIQKYDADMGDKQTELEELEAVYEEEKAQLAELKEKLAVLEVEYVQIMEERRLAQLRKEAEEEELARKNHAATIIQAHWKGYQVRKTMKSKKKKKKGKGKGKGKGASSKGKGKK